MLECMDALQETITQNRVHFSSYWKTIEMGIFRKIPRFSPVFTFCKFIEKR